MKKTPRIHFKGTKEINEEKRLTQNVINNRIKLIIVFVLAVGVLFAGRLLIIQVGQNTYYNAKLDEYNANTFQVDALRGEITDRNYKKLVYNKNVINATYYAVSGIKEEERVAIVNFLVKNCKIDISSVTTREKKDYLIMKEPEFVKSLITEEEYKQLREEEDFDTQYYNLQLKRITKKILKKHLSNDDVRYYKLYYAIKNCRSGYANLIENISIKEAGIIGENSYLLRGIVVTSDWQRAYTNGKLLRQTLGRITTKKQGIPANLKDQLLALDYSNDARYGTSGIESQYEDILSGEKSLYELTYDSNGNPIVKEKNPGSNGQNIQLTIDMKMQKHLTKLIDKELRAHRGEAKYAKHIYAMVADPETGDILAMVGREINKKTGKISECDYGTYQYAYRIGSTMKASVIYTCFKNRIINKNHYETDTAEGIKIAGTKAKHSWNLKGLGNLNEVTALAYSSNIYMMKLVIKLGNGTYRYNQPLDVNPNAFTLLRNGAGELGLGVKSGIDLPSETLGYRGNSTLPGNLLDFSIGQYDTYSMMQLITYTMTIANDGVRIKPHLYKSSFAYDKSGEIITLNQYNKEIVDDVSYEKDAFKQIKKGMRAVVTYGTGASAFSGFEYDVAGKTGTAEDYTGTGNTDHPNHIFIGFGPYGSKPKVCVAVLAERQLNNASHMRIAKSAFSYYFKKYGYKK
ncbi:MAG: penicillin-binding protein 2 [Erysipelotrichaceae bacterium]|nr:penicillin-binding protein 2 [Erysipelotrichaceae bacterium]